MPEWVEAPDTEGTEDQPEDTERDSVRASTAGFGFETLPRGATTDGDEGIGILPIPSFFGRGPATLADAGDQTAEGS